MLVQRVTGVAVLIGAGFVVSTTSARAQDAERRETRWSLSPTLLVSSSPLAGGAMSVTFARRGRLELDARVMVLWAASHPLDVLNPNAGGVAPRYPYSGPARLTAVGLAPALAISARWYLIGQLSHEQSTGWYESYQAAAPLGFTLGVAHQSRDGRRRLELSAHRVGGGEQPTRGGLLSWRFSW